MSPPQLSSPQLPSNTRVSHSFLAPLTIFLIFAALSTGIIWRLEQDRYNLERNRALIIAHTKTNPIQNSIDRALSATYSVAALIRQGKGNFPDFAATVTQLLPFYPGVASLDIAPGGVISDIVPLKGNEKAIGFDILNDPKQKDEAARTRDSGKLTLAGPLNLIEGGLGAVGRLPVFLDRHNGQKVFWGLTCVVLKFPDVLAPAQLDELIKEGYQYELWRIHPESNKKQTIATSSSTPLKNPVDYSFDIHNGKWILSVTPTKGWSNSWLLMLECAMGIIISTILAFTSFLLVKLHAHKHELEEKVLERTADLKKEILANKQAEEERRQLELRYQQAKKMESIGVLAGGIAHDFNNILSGIIGYTNMSLQYAENESRLGGNLQKVLQASNRAKNMVKQIVTFSRQDNPIKVVTAIQPIITEVLDLLKGSLPAEVIINAELSVEAKPVVTDSTKMHELILNLATNAVHAMNRAGTLTVRLYALCLDTGVYGLAKEIPAGEYSVIEVSDTGCGMDAETLAKAFEPFFTTKAVDEGTGMGLSVVIGVVQSYGGDIQVESVVGKGTTFRIYFPASAESVPFEDFYKPDVQISGTEGILIVDDELMLLEIAENVLNQQGYRVSSKSDSREALTFFQENSADIDLLITDFTMPGMTGVELAKMALKIKQDLIVILCTGNDSEINPQRAKAIGISQIVFKPLEMNKISRIIRNLLYKKNEEFTDGSNTGDR